MIRFECDYAEGAHPRILERLSKTNFVQTPGYGRDEYCARAAQHIKKLCKSDNCDVHFFVGGTQTNLTTIAAMLKPYEGVISADTGHINAHETGAIEACGHKVLTLPSPDGKITAAQVREMYLEHVENPEPEHIVFPGMVYISHPTENGTIYTKKELTELNAVCREFDIPLFMDGARLGYGLAAIGNDLEIHDIAALCDAFYIGGTKIGALFGEALVIMHDKYKKNFRYHIKQRGALLAKGRLLGLQFETMFEDGLYMEIAKNAIDCILIIKKACENAGFQFLYDSPTNQLFPVLTNEESATLAKKYAFHEWAKVDEKHVAVRFCTSWATNKESAEALARDIEKLRG